MDALFYGLNYKFNVQTVTFVYIWFFELSINVYMVINFKRSFGLRFCRCLEIGCLEIKDNCVWLYMENIIGIL